MADGLRVHDAIVRGTIERHGGYVFGTGGDGFCAAFSTAADAAAAAIESQEQLRDDAAVNFLVRMGLHTGEAIERDRNYFGSEVNRAARLMSLAHGGQVLVSDATEVLLRNRVALRPLGEHRLRGLRGRMSVYQVVADGLPADFPVLRSVDYFTGNLPQQLSSLVGRENVVAEVAELVAVEPAGHAERRRRGRQDPAGPRSRGRGGRRVPRRRVDGRAGVGRRPGLRPSGHRDRARHHAAGRRGPHRHGGRGAGRSAAPSGGRQLRARPRRGGIGHRDDPRPVREREDPRHVARDPRGRRRDGAHRGAARLGGWRDLRCRHAVRRSSPSRPAQLRALGAGDRDRGDRDLRDPRRAPAGDRAGCRANGRHERGRGQGSARRSVPAVEGVDAGAGTTAHAPPRGGVVLRPLDRRRAGAAPPDVGLRRRLRPDEHLRRGRRGRRRGRAQASRLVGPKVARRRRPHRHPHPLQPLRDHPPVRRGPVGGDGRARADSRPARRVLRTGVRRPMGALERARVARRGRLGGGGARQPTFRISVERGARRAGGGDRHRRACRAHGFLGAVVRNARLGRGAARARSRRRRPPSSPPVHGGWLRVLRGKGGGGARERAPGDRAGGRPPLRRV